MGVRENKVETYLKDEVKRVFGGETRKWVSPGHVGVNDQILFIPYLPAIFAEVKTIDGVSSGSQIREHERLVKTKTTSIFITIYGKKDVDKWIELFAHRVSIEQQHFNRANRKGQKHPVVVTMMVEQGLGKSCHTVRDK